MIKLLSTPFLPQNKVSCVAVSGENSAIISALHRLNIATIEIVPNYKLDKSIRNHADCMILPLKDEILIDETQYCGNEEFVNYFTNIEGNITEQLKVCEKRVCSPYPNDVIMNIKVIGNKILCNTKYVADEVSAYVANHNISLIHCNQGYCGCSCIIINDNALITDDESIYVSCKSNGIDCICVDKGSVQLSGHSYGFIGGGCGMIDRNTLAFCGELEKHSEYKKIKQFLMKYEINYINLIDGDLIDIGGIIPLTEEQS